MLVFITEEKLTLSFLWANSGLRFKSENNMDISSLWLLSYVWFVIIEHDKDYFTGIFFPSSQRE